MPRQIRVFLEFVLRQAVRQIQVFLEFVLRQAVRRIQWMAMMLLLCGVGLLQPVVAQDWTRFRGPNGSGVGQAKNLPGTWTEEDYNWVAPLPGSGHSSAVTWGERLFVTSADLDRGERYLLCLNTGDGKVAWQRKFEFTKHAKHKTNSFATNTPALDSSHVYVLWQQKDSSVLSAFTHAGDPVWSSNLGTFRGGHGPGVSPMVFEDLVIVANDQDGPSSLLALDTKTGKQVWQIARESKRTSYATPSVYRPEGREAEIIFTDMHHGISAVGAKSGKLIWELDVFGDFKQRAIASPVVAGDLIIGTSGFTTAQKNVVLVRPTATDEGVTATEVYRLSRQVPHIPSPLAYEDMLFLWTDRGIVTCVELATGKQLWQKRVGGNYFSSPILADGKLYNVDLNGTVHVIQAASEYKYAGKSELGHPTRATPSVGGGVLYFRTESHVYSLGKP